MTSRFKAPLRAAALVSAMAVQLTVLGCGSGLPSISVEGIVRPVTTNSAACDGGLMDGGKLKQAVEWINTNRNYIDSFLLKYCDQMLVEDYYNGFSAETLHEIQSATKTFTGTLIAIALKNGVVRSLDQPIHELLPKYRDMLSGKKAEITVRHLLTMTSGLEWTDFGPNNSFDRIHAAPDSVAFVVGEPLQSSPGEKFFYNTGSSHLLAAIIHYNTGMTVSKYAEEHLFGPLKIKEYLWPALRDGINQGGWGIYMKPKDFLKLSQLYRDRGKWDDQQIVEESFVVDAMKAHVTTPYPDSGYGYQMWIQQDFGKSSVAGARGYGGQDAFILTEQQTSVVFTGSIQQPSQMAKDIRHLMKVFVIPAYQ